MGICVDVYVYRIIERFGWTFERAIGKNGLLCKKMFEDMCVLFECWFFWDEWIEINLLLVGFG